MIVLNEAHVFSRTKFYFRYSLVISPNFENANKTYRIFDTKWPSTVKHPKRTWSYQQPFSIHLVVHSFQQKCCNKMLCTILSFHEGSFSSNLPFLLHEVLKFQHRLPEKWKGKITLKWFNRALFFLIHTSSKKYNVLDKK